MFTHCNRAFSLRPGQIRLPQPLEFSQPRTESPALLAPEPCRSARRPSGQDSTGPSFGLTAPARSHLSGAFHQRTSPGDIPLRCKLSRSGRFSPVPSATSPEVSLQNPQRALPEQAKPRSSERLAGRRTPLPQASQLATARLLGSLDRKRQRPRSRGPAGDGVLRAPSRQPQSNLPPSRTTTPRGLCDSQHASRRRAQPSLFSFGFCLGLGFRKTGDRVRQIASPSRLTSALESLVCPRPLRRRSGGTRSPAVGTTPEATEKGLM